MCGFCGYINKDENITNDLLIKDMNSVLKKRGPNAQDVFLNDNVALGHSRLSIIDVTYGAQPMIKEINDKKYVIVYNGELYNTKELRDNLEKKGYTFSTNSDTEVILTSYIHYKDKCVDYFNGIFAFAIYDISNKNIFLARDRLGIKPLFYSMTKSSFVFASEIKSILKHKDVKRVINKDGIMEMIGLGPAHTPGKTFFKDIFEIKPGHIANFKDFNLSVTKYWDLETKQNLDTEDIAIETIHDLVVDATKKQLVSDVGICSMLSGGLDSSILSKIAKDNIPTLQTFSIDYVDNDKNFTSNDYQLTKDSDYVKIMKNYLKSNHKTITVENKSLYDYLEKSVIARDMPGMADIDSSMYVFCEKIAKSGYKVCLSGECSDEIFGGYPWYYKEHLISHDGFPWALSEDLRENILNKNLKEKINIKEYISNAIKDTLKDVVHLDTEDDYEKRFRDVNYLTIKWFMNTLIERTDRASMSTSLEVRVPFADHRIFEYVYNLPARMKLGISKDGTPTEKYLLRKAFENELPKEIAYRKKSPFPKTYDPKYLELVENRTLEILQNDKLKIHQIIDKEFVESIISNHGKTLKQNWFGQLMTYPQTLAYIISISYFLETYDVEIEI